MSTANLKELAQMAESSEAAAYRSLVDVAQTAGVEHCSCFNINGATAFVSPSVRTTLILNRVIGLGLSAPADEAQLDEIAALYEPHRLPWALELGPAVSPTELFDWLKARRIRRTLATSMLYRSCNDIPQVDTDIEIRLWQPEHGDAGANLAAEIFRVPEPVRAILARLPYSANWRQWQALDGEEIVATSLVFLGEGVAWSGWDATKPSHRGRNLHGVLIAARMKDALDHGCSWLTSETAVGTADSPDQSYRNFIRLGFQVAYQRHTFLSMPSRTKT